MIRKKSIKQYIIIVIVLSLILNTTLFGADTINYNEAVRVGLVTYNDNIDKIKISNTSLSMGYHVNGEYKEEVSIHSSGGLSVIAAKEFYVISDETYKTYDEIIPKIESLRSKGYTAYPGNVDFNKWRVYLGSVNTKSEAEAVLNSVRNNDDLTYSIAGDNGSRIIAHTSDTPSIVFENTEKNLCIKGTAQINNTYVTHLGNRSYRGEIEVGRYGKSGVTAINLVKLHEYLYGVLPAEMPRTWPEEALKAQAVAARNYVIYYKYIKPKYPNEAYDVCDTVSCQVYKGFNYEYEETNSAVDATKNKLIYHNDQLIVAFFFSTSGGHTENSENVWSNSVPYLKGKADIYETNPEKGTWTETLTSWEIKSKLEKRGVYLGNITSVDVTSYTSAGRAMGLKIVGTNGSYTLKKETMRYWLGLNSRKFEIVGPGYQPNTNFYAINEGNEKSQVSYHTAYVVSGDQQVQQLKSGLNQLAVISSENITNHPLVSGVNGQYTFAGVGWGHGVGMSQSGARGMALEGFTYDEILEYYYTDCLVK